MIAQEAIAFIRLHGIVVEAAKGPAPSLVEAITGAPLRGNWWSHPRGKEIFQITRAVRSSSQILVCRLILGKITFVHKRLWPALVRSADLFPLEYLAQVSEEHADTGQHILKTVAFPEWVPAAVFAQASKLTEPAALDLLGSSVAPRSGDAIKAVVKSKARKAAPASG